MQRTVTFPDLTITITTTEENATYALKGHITHVFRHNTIPRSQTPHITFDLEGVELVTSVGLQAWVLLIKAWSKTQKIFYEKCSICFVDQLNMVEEMIGEATIVSFYAPFYCNKCSLERNCLIDLRIHHGAITHDSLPKFTCECESPEALEFDALPDYYLSFLQSRS
ncbi:MAG: hypothetical protein OXC44_04110 [Proteobacteria bacterium]|nr:hypothetical protein [Pseudomonadota bacterium]